jgi:hypothetical protein
MPGGVAGAAAIIAALADSGSAKEYRWDCVSGGDGQVATNKTDDLSV